MKFRPAVLSFILVSILSAFGCSKAPVLVIVDVDRVVNESKEAKTVIGEVESFAKTVEAQLNKGADQIQSASADPKADPAKINEMRMQFNQIVRQAQEEVDNRRKQTVDEVHKKIEVALNSLAKENGWDIVIRKGPQAALWNNEALDQTKLVIERMDGAPKTKPQQQKP